MKMDEYLKLALNTEVKDYATVTLQDKRLLHATLGLVTESGEFADSVKRSLFYKQEYDRTNAIEELGDVMWYIALAIDILGTSFDEVMEKNIAKLAKRYPDKYTDYHALNRDLESERKILECKEIGSKYAETTAKVLSEIQPIDFSSFCPSPNLGLLDG